MQQSHVGTHLQSFGRACFDLLLLTAATLTTIPLALLTEGPVRVAFAFPFIIFTPGYCLIAALYPRKDSLDTIERVALSFATSIAVVPLIGLVLNYTPWGIRLIPILLGVSGFVLAASAVAALRRRRLGEGERFSVPLALPTVRLFATSGGDRLLSLMLAASIVFAIGTLIYVVATPRQAERFTEFYILGPGGMAEGYPTAVRVGEPAHLIMGIVNHEGEPVEYRIEARIDGNAAAVELRAAEETARQAGAAAFFAGPLEPEQAWEQQVTVTALTPGEQLKLEFLLFSPRPRDGYHLRALLAGDGYVSMELHEAKGRATVVLQAGTEQEHECRIEAWQDGRIVTEQGVQVPAGEQRTVDFRYPQGEALFRVYDGTRLVLDDSGAELALHLWVDAD